MLHSVYGINAARLNSITATLQQMQDDPEALQRSMRRFDSNDPPPPYSSAGSTEPPTPIFRSHRQATAHQLDELVRRPLDDEELQDFAYFRGYNPEHPYFMESNKERDRISDVWTMKRDELGRPLYRGPDLIGRPGSQRKDIMARNSIRKRWEKLGVWNPEWGIPVRGAGRGPEDFTGNWSWKWRRPFIGPLPPLPSPASVAARKWAWPPRYQESVDQRAVREYLERKGEWTGPQAPTQEEAPSAAQVDMYHEASRITSRPWYQWQLEVKEEHIRLNRLWRFAGIPQPFVSRPYEKETANVMERWKARGDWKNSWGDSPGDSPGWKWRHESPSPEPEDPNEMDFSPSEIDALESIRPATPPPPWNLAPISEAERRRHESIFGQIFNPNRPASAQPSEDTRRNDENRADGTAAVDNRSDRSQSQISNALAAPAVQQSGEPSAPKRDQRASKKPVRFVPDESLSSAQDHVLTRPQARSLRKRKRDEESDKHTRESSLSLNTQPESRQQKRARTTRSTGQLPRQSGRSVEFSGTVAHGQSQTKKGRTHATMEQLSPGPRRSARIAQLQKARAGSGQGTKPGITRKQEDNVAPLATRPSKRSRSKRSETRSRTDNRHTKRGQNGTNTRTRSS